MANEEPVPQPGPARISKGAGPDEWLEQAKQCKYLPESDMKRLCEIVKECLMEGELISTWHFLQLYPELPYYGLLIASALWQRPTCLSG